MTAATRTQAMLTARAKASHDKRQRALAAIQALEAAGIPVTATAVATAAGVSTWLAYADGVREHVQAARRRQAEHGHAPRVASLETASRQLAAERDARAAEASHAQRRIRELEDELTAAREGLRRVIRQASR